MKILTLNTWQERGPWLERWELIFHGLKVYDADIVGFQEVFNMDWAEEARERSGYPYLAVSGQHSGLIFFSKFKPVEEECIFLPKSPNEDYNRYAFYTRFDTGKEGLAAFNTHLSWKKEDDQVRGSQVRGLVEFIDRKAGAAPAVAMGDFNTAPGTDPIKFLTGQAGWRDTFALANPGQAGLTWDYRNPYAEMERDKMAERRIDYIFVTREAGPFKGIRLSRVVFDKPAGGVWPSDHLGVLTEFSDGG
ncbi:MAG: Endonuclease/Exonuclease/phosphatase family protein [Candidatus Omnitrophica bacterium ADurb.Bin277]|nr:MAG: Endonuclease/Exonuclease/phosphatase family protein [Candidatus Omnitrophica bacterium ADurb.Bin277]